LCIHEFCELSNPSFISHKPHFLFCVALFQRDTRRDSNAMQFVFIESSANGFSVRILQQIRYKVFCTLMILTCSSPNVIQLRLSERQNVNKTISDKYKYSIMYIFLIFLFCIFYIYISVLIPLNFF